jgi:hypothetical protein
VDDRLAEPPHLAQHLGKVGHDDGLASHLAGPLAQGQRLGVVVGGLLELAHLRVDDAEAGEGVCLTVDPPSLPRQP